MSLRAQSLKDIFTFTRSTTATYWNSSGELTTAAVDEPRIDYDPVTLACRGLLIEETRTNLVLNSANFVTQNVTVTNAAHTLSFYGTGTIALTGTASPEVSLVGTGANTRVSLAFLPAAGTLTLTLSGSATMAQLEAGPHATSYIPTASVPVTRETDICSTSVLSPWFNEPAGSLFAEYTVPWSHNEFIYSGFYIVQVDDGTADNRHVLYHSLGYPAGYTSASGVEQANPVSGNTIVANTIKKLAYAWSDDDVVLFEPSAISDTDATMPGGLVGIRIGAYTGGTLSLNGHIRKVKFYPRRLSNTELAALVA
jgi:hypothetical protein